MHVVIGTEIINMDRYDSCDLIGKHIRFYKEGGIGYIKGFASEEEAEEQWEKIANMVEKWYTVE